MLFLIACCDETSEAFEIPEVLEQFEGMQIPRCQADVYLAVPATCKGSGMLVLHGW